MVVENTSTYESVRHKKSEGNIELDEEGFTYQPSVGSPLGIPWSRVSKHQVSPATHPKSLLKVILNDGNSLTFRLPARASLERIRRDITGRLQQAAGATASTTTNSTASSSSGKKRSHSQLSTSLKTQYGKMDATSLAVTRSSLLAANPALRQQYHFLVTETKTVSEEDFWKTHQAQVEEEYAKISGTVKAGTPSLLQSHLPLQGKVTLGVEEMRQIFVLYPAVHKAYEEKVPLELSDEQFWRKYLESEYFHRDRGRLGTAARNHSSAAASAQAKQNGNKKNATASGKTYEEEEARAAAVGTDDMFSRYDAKLREQQLQQNGGSTVGAGSSSSSSTHQHRKWGTKLGVGQFDLAATAETERGYLLEGPRDEYPPNDQDGGKGARVVQKYNRHWAMVLHPDEAVAGSNLMEVARKSVAQTDEVEEEEAKPLGGFDREMRQLVGYANASEEDADHVRCTRIEDDNLEELTLANIETYHSGKRTNKQAIDTKTDEETRKRNAVFSKATASKLQALAAPFLAPDAKTAPPELHEEFFPPAQLGRELLSALTKKMAADAKTEEDAMEIVNKLPEDFRKRLHTYFRRSSELLRHFYGLRRLDARGGATESSQLKLTRIVKGLEVVYREIEVMRKEQPPTEMGEIMRKMCLPIMDQLDWAFQLNREGSGAGASGGFVTVEEL
jgi:transcription initiation factor TFIIH subunit 1